MKVHRWQAHQDLINQVTFIPELEDGVIATCSFDCNVYLWRKDDCKQVGSLVLGTGLSQQGEQTAAEKRKYAKIWQININKEARRSEARDEADRMLTESTDTVYETMFMKGNKDQGLLEAHKKGGGKEAQQAAEKKQKGKDGKKAKRNFDDELQAPNETDE